MGRFYPDGVGLMLTRNKSLATKRTHAEQLQKLADRYYAETGQETATASEIAKWAIREGHWSPPRDLVHRQCREDFASAMREQYIRNDDGLPVRAKHVARMPRGEAQTHLWADIHTAPRAFMEIAFSQRREQIVGDCRQLDRDVAYFNSRHPGEGSIQLEFDFTEDVAEGRFSEILKHRKPR